MGWDSYCCLCANSCKNVDIAYLIELFETHNKYNKTKNLIKINITEIKNIVKKLKWTKKTFSLQPTNVIFNSTNKIDCEDYLPFKNSSYFDNEILNGVFIHQDCWHFCKKNYNIELKYKDLPVRYLDSDKNPPLYNIDYGEITKYLSQDFSYDGLYLDNNIYMLDSPLISTNKKNISRIKKIINQFNIKKEERPSPSISATFYKYSEIKLGNDNFFWIIQNGRWNKINEMVFKKTIIFDKKFNKNIKKLSIINKIPAIGEYSKEPLFVLNFKKNNKDETTIIFIGIEKNLNNLQVIINK
jgi:hypothetical protein